MNRLRQLLEAHADSGSRLTVRRISLDRNEPGEADPAPIEDSVLLEGSSDSLRFLGELLIAFAEGDFGCSFHLHPRGAGSAHFSGVSDVGLSFHKNPCDLE